MARKRMIDPSIWSDDGMAQLTPRQQLLYVGLISNADDAGRLKASPVAIRLACPTIYYHESDDSVIQDDIDAVLEVMTQLTWYESEGKPYLAFKNYLTWQKIDRPQDSKLPEPPEHAENKPVREQSSNNRRTVVPNRSKEKLREVKRTEQNLAPKTPRERNPIWDALVGTCGEPATKSESGDFGKTVKELTQARASPPDIVAFGLWWDRTFPDAQLTHRCYRQHWGKFANAPPPRPLQPTAIKNNLTRAILTTDLDDDDDRPGRIQTQNGRAIRIPAQPRRLRGGE